MDVIDPGHYYQLHALDVGEEGQPLYGLELCFVKREGEGYPGNVGHHSGTTTQEVLRALIDRTKYVDNQIPHEANKLALYHLRTAMWQFERRAAERHGRAFPYDYYNIENFPTCETCGHIGCTDHE